MNVNVLIIWFKEKHFQTVCQENKTKSHLKREKDKFEVGEKEEKRNIETIYGPRMFPSSSFSRAFYRRHFSLSITVSHRHVVLV